MRAGFLMALSTAYLLIPNLLFFFYWTRPEIAVAGTALLLYLFADQTVFKDFPTESSLLARDWAYLIMVALILTSLSGITGICYQYYDYWGQNTKFYELYAHEWPLRYPESGPSYSYYFGYYLVPALLSKMAGGISETAIFIWTWIGLCLGIAWLYLVLNKKMGYVLLCFCIGDTPAVLIKIINRLGIDIASHFGKFKIEIYALSTSIMTVPNQIIPTLLLGGMLVYFLRSRVALENSVFPIALSLWWSVFPALTCGLLVGVLIVRKWTMQNYEHSWLDFARKVVLPATICLPILLLFASHQEVPISGFIWQFSPASGNLLNYLVEICFNSLVFLFAYRVIREQGVILPEFPFYLTLLFVLILPVYRIGLYNDFTYNGLMPFTLILALYLLSPLAAQESRLTIVRVARKSLINFTVLFLLLISSQTSLKHVYYALKVNFVSARLFPDRVSFRPLPYDTYPTIYDMLREKYTQTDANQYLGKKNSFYEQYISKPKP